MSNESELERLLKTGLQQQQQGNLQQALQYYDKVLQAMPLQIDAAYFKSIILLEQPSPSEAIQLLSPVIEQSFQPEFHPALARCHRVLGTAYQRLGNLEIAILHFRTAKDLDPAELDYAADLIQALLANNQSERATVELNSLPPTALSHLRCLATMAEVCWSTWKVTDCLAHLQTALKLAPAQLDLVSQCLFVLNYLDADGPEVAQQHVALGGALNQYYRSDFDDTQAPASINNPAKNHLRIGFLSPDLKNHSVAYFLLPLLRELHHRENVWVACYALNSTLDSVSETIRNLSDHFVQLTDRASLHTIENDHIDLLFDLAGHSAGNILPQLMASPKPAPIIVNWLGYANTSGFPYHNYRFVDTITDPAASRQPEPCAETRIHFSPSFLCYEPPINLPEVGPLPAKTSAAITIGCLNNLNKITISTLELWSEILQKDSRFRLLVKSHMFSNPTVTERFIRPFLAKSIDPDRIEMRPRDTHVDDHLRTYQSIDFSWDTFPYNGTTTTCESLLMGCPVITLQGNTHRSRVSSSILSNLGRTDWIATSKESFVQQSIALASNLETLDQIRETLRQDFLRSSVCDAQTFGNQFVKTCHTCKRPVNSL